MFGHDNTKDEDQDTSSATINPTFDLGGQPPQDADTPVDSSSPSPLTPPADNTNAFDPTSLSSDDTSSTDSPSEEPEGTPLITSVSTPNQPTATVSTSTTDDTDENTTSSPATPEKDELFELKKKSLEELSPLLGHLDQTAEEKYKTTMMMIQATDDSSLIQSAHDAALEISDEKVRAQALLDIVNEINYFTQVANDKK